MTMALSLYLLHNSVSKIAPKVINNRLGVVYNRKDYLCAMETVEIQSRTMLRLRRSKDVHRFMANLLIYTMKYGGNTDRSGYKR